jgi:hypothetical protein
MRTPLAFLFVLLGSLAAGAPAALGAGDPLRAQQWALDTIQADAAHATSTGSGAVVAVIDSGVLGSHEDLAGRLVAGHDFVQDDSTPQDENGHGTHVTGIIAAVAGNGKGIEGVAPGAQVMPIRVLNKKGEGSGDVVAKGIDYAVAHHADVINLSLGGNAADTVLGGDDKFTQAVQNALKHGVVVIAAAGNDTAPFCEQPAVTGPLLCVGAIDRRQMRTYYSSSGDLVAPGGSATLGGSDEDILSTWNNGKYDAIAGTSQATPHVSGVAALLVSLGLHGQAVVDRILSTTTDAGLPGPDDVYGAGILNARAAVAGLGGGGGGVTPGFSYKHIQRIATVMKHGVNVTCRASAAGNCKVRVTAGGKLIARGSRSFGGPGRAAVAAKVTKAGRQMLKGAKTVKATVVVSVPGAAGAAASGGKLTLVRWRARQPRSRKDRPMAYLKPAPFVKHVFNPIARKFGMGGARELVVKRRNTGEEQKIPVIPVEHDGARYIVSTRGESDWVRNMRAAGGGELRGKSGAQAFMAAEVPEAERGPIIAAYRVVAGKTVTAYWDKLPDDADHPVFRIEPAAQ